MSDIIESVLLADQRYVEQCDMLDVKLESLSEEDIDEICDNMDCEYPTDTVNIDDDELEEGDYIDREVSDFLDAAEDETDGDIIDIVSGMCNADL